MDTLSRGKFRASLLAAFLAVAPLSPVAQAQDLGMSCKINLPFAFHVGSRQFTAGVYTIRMENRHTMVIRGESQSGLAMTWVDDDGQPAKRGKVVFQKYGNQYFLSDISVAGKSEHLHFLDAKTERQLQVAGNRPAPASVELALSGAAQ